MGGEEEFLKDVQEILHPTLETRKNLDE